MIIEFSKKYLKPLWYIWHWLSHLLGSNTGKVVSWNDNGDVFVAFMCDCGSIDRSTIERIKMPKFLNDEEPNYKEEE